MVATYAMAAVARETGVFHHMPVMLPCSECISAICTRRPFPGGRLPAEARRDCWDDASRTNPRAWCLPYKEGALLLEKLPTVGVKRRLRAGRHDTRHFPYERLDSARASWRGHNITPQPAQRIATAYTHIHTYVNTPLSHQLASKPPTLAPKPRPTPAQ